MHDLTARKQAEAQRERAIRGGSRAAERLKHRPSGCGRARSGSG
jgi:hypothetical protein